MSTLVLVRHGKASPHGADYDELSPPGIAQSRLLGVWFARALPAPRAVFVGPRKRHAQTERLVREELEERAVAWPVPTPLRDLDEHEAIALLFKTMPQLAETEPRVREIAEMLARGETPPLEGLLGLFRRVVYLWARGELSHEEVEGWSAFRARVARALHTMAESIDRGETAVAFTSGGFVAAAVGFALDLGDEKVLDLGFSLHNAAITELQVSRDEEKLRWGLRSFNGVPHLEDPALVTSV